MFVYTILLGGPQSGMTGVAAADTQDDLARLRKLVTSFCDGAGYLVSPQCDEILHDIVHMKEDLGDFYCPCQTQKTPETVCICQPVRQGLVDLMGACFCGLVLRKE
jgi:ferredoxin-thioredoxin reductase catalytic subunit